MVDLLAIADAIEQAGDEYRAAIDAAAEAEAAFLKAFHIAMTQVSFEPATARKSLAEVRASDEKQALVRAEAAEKRWKSKVDELQSRLMAAMSYQKYLGRADGGGF